VIWDPASTHLPEERLTFYEEMAEQATPWLPQDCQYHVEADGWVRVQECATLGETLIMLSHDYENDGADWRLVAHARTAIPALCAEVRRLRERIEEGG
jgi:hypothetical protein